MSKNKNCCPEKVNALINNTATRFTEAHREWLETFSSEELETMEPKLRRKDDDEDEPTPKKKTPKKKSEEEDDDEVQVNAQQVQEFISTMPQAELVGILPESLKTVIQAYEAQREATKKEKVTRILAVHKEVWTEAELNAMEDVQLEKIEKTLPASPDLPVDYSLNGGAGVQVNASEEILLPPGVPTTTK